MEGMQGSNGAAGMEGDEACAFYFFGTFTSISLAFSLLLHHNWKHREDLQGRERCFQIEDVCVCCDTKRPWYQRCSHEMWIVLSLIVFVCCFWALSTLCDI